MSRYEFPGRDPQHTIAIGWDNPLSTFFGQVLREVEDEHEEDPIVFWIGGAPAEVASVEDLARHLAPFADLSVEMMAQLRADRADKIGQHPTPTQQDALRFIRRPR